MFTLTQMEGRNDSVGTATGYLLGGREIGVRLLTGERGFSLLHNVHTGPGALPAFYSIHTGVSLPGF
jgi:hypothetical protein